VTAARWRVPAAFVIVAAGLGGCGTAYLPRAGPRIELVIHHGGAFYQKNGVETPVGPLGGDLVGLVGGQDEAVRYARRSRNELAAGVPLYVTGIAAVVIGLAVAKPAGWFIAGAGAASTATGITLIGAGAVNAVDAVHVYNDVYNDRVMVEPTTP
jgi:hypothetical protein